MKTQATLTTSIALLLAALMANSADTQRVTPTQIFMRQKTAYSQKIIEGIVLEHYSQIATNAVKLWNMTQTNAWANLQMPDYREMSLKFQVDTSKLIVAAHASNCVQVLDAYNRVTADCVNCHQHFRREQHDLKSSRAPSEASRFDVFPANVPYSATVRK